MRLVTLWVCAIHLIISIHAPHTGCDRRRRRSRHRRWNFNPRTPYGVRPDKALTTEHAEAISIHAPHTGCDYGSVTQIAMVFEISIHAPHTGCDDGLQQGRTGWVISIHAPHTGCDVSSFSMDMSGLISIHAPHTGCDVPLPGAFNLNPYISIHAPHTGCDELWLTS